MGQLGSEQIIDGQKTSKSTYAFDKIYGASAGNMEVYVDSCKDIIESVIKGFNGKTSILRIKLQVLSLLTDKPHQARLTQCLATKIREE